MNTEDFKNVLAVTASISTILQFLAGTLICQKIVQKKSTADISGFPFVCGFLSITLWLRYGFLIQDHSLILVNTVGSTLHLAYIVTFYVYSIKKSVTLRQFLGCLLILAVSITYSIYERDREICAKYIGFLCCLTTIVFFAAPLTSLVHVVRVKSADSLPFPIIFMTFVVSVQWFVYGLLLSDSYIQIPNFLGCVLSGFQLSFFFVYSKDPPKTAGYNPVHNF